MKTTIPNDLRASLRRNLRKSAVSMVLRKYFFGWCNSLLLELRMLNYVCSQQIVLFVVDFEV